MYASTIYKHISIQAFLYCIRRFSEKKVVTDTPNKIRHNLIALKGRILEGIIIQLTFTCDYPRIHSGSTINNNAFTDHRE